MAVGMFAVVAPLQLLVGDLSGKEVLHVQPAKLAAIEGFWETRSEQPFHILAWPDRAIEGNRFELSVPKLGSFITSGSSSDVVKGLKDFAPRDRPPVFIVFWSFRIMVGLGVLMIGLGAWGVWLILRRRLEATRLFLWSAVAMGPAGFVAVICGWIVAEVGRQPYTVYGLMRTSESVSPVGAGEVTASLLGFMIVYAIIFTVGVLYILRLIVHGPQAEADAPTTGGEGPGNPLAAVREG
jgi:cytochrome d ubiquinol oxidase subunit I